MLFQRNFNDLIAI